MKFHLFSFFSGAGFLDYGFESVGYEIDLVNEIHPPFLEAYKYSRKNLSIVDPRYGYYDCDIMNFLDPCTAEGSFLNSAVSEVKREALVGFIGGPPCPDFSIGGKNKGRLGDNGRLSGAYADLIRMHRPHFFLFENVKGLWSTRRHREFYEHIKKELAEADYILTDQLINCIQYGVPQDRERVILLGFHRDIVPSDWLDDSGDLTERLYPWSNSVVYDTECVFKLPWVTTEPFGEGKDTCPANVIEELTVGHWFDKNAVKSHPNASQHFKPRAGLARFLTVDEGDVSRKSYKRLHRWRYSPTACYGNNEVHLHPTLPRRLSVAEVLAIQSLPREFILPPDMTLSNAFKTVGNGVPYLAARGIAKTLSDFLVEALR